MGGGPTLNQGNAVTEDGYCRRDFSGAPVFKALMLPFYSFTFWLLVACAVFFYRAGEFEGTSGGVWAGLSVLISGVIWLWFHGDSWLFS